MADIADLLTHSIESSAKDFETAFNDIMAQRVAVAIEDKYSAMYPNSFENSLEDVDIDGDD